MVPDSQAYKNMEMTSECIGITFDLNVMLVLIGFHIVGAAVACAILESPSGFEPLCETIAPNYLKRVTIPSLP